MSLGRKITQYDFITPDAPTCLLDCLVDFVCFACFFGFAWFVWSGWSGLVWFGLVCLVWSGWSGLFGLFGLFDLFLSFFLCWPWVMNSRNASIVKILQKKLLFEKMECKTLITWKSNDS